MINNGLGALLKYGAVLSQLVPVFPLQPLRGKLNRRKRILDLVRHAAGHLTPGSGAFRLLQLSQILKHNDNAGVVAFLISDRRYGQ